MHISLEKLNQETGIQFSGMINAAQLAACCGATLSLPVGYLWSQPRLFRFPYTNPHKFCEQNLSGGTDRFFYRPIPQSCRDHRFREKAYRTLFTYLNFPFVCPKTYDVVAHVRPLTTHSDYPQPPFNFYLEAWKHIGIMHPLTVVHKDSSNPVVSAWKLVKFLGNVTLASHSDFKQDLKILLCAKHLIMSKSSLSHLILLNPSIQTFYEYETRSSSAFPNYVSNASLQYYSTKHGKYISNWNANPTQLNKLLTDDTPLTFQKHKLMSL